ncbi:MAG: hypothetical protein IJ594_01125 [Oscillospiraceae bacterium]|nr:hypothetical protein [Oscillospiraceae bacterium]
MKQIPIKLGPLTLLLTVISICLTTLAILTFTTARADMRLAEKFADTVQTRYALEAQGQDFLREIRDLDPADLSLMDLERDASGVYWKTLEQDGSKLRIGFTFDRNGSRVTAWRQEKEWEQETGIPNLWNGF